MFDEHFQSWGGEDTDLGLALDRAGIAFFLNRKAEAIHFPHQKCSYHARNDVETWQIQKQKAAYLHQKYRTQATRLMLSERLEDINQLLLQQRFAHISDKLVAGRICAASKPSCVG